MNRLLLFIAAGAVGLGLLVCAASWTVPPSPYLLGALTGLVLGFVVIGFAQEWVRHGGRRTPQAGIPSSSTPGAVLCALWSTASVGILWGLFTWPDYYRTQPEMIEGCVRAVPAASSFLSRSGSDPSLRVAEVPGQRLLVSLDGLAAGSLPIHVAHKTVLVALLLLGIAAALAWVIKRRALFGPNLALEISYVARAIVVSCGMLAIAGIAEQLGAHWTWSSVLNRSEILRCGDVAAGERSFAAFANSGVAAFGLGSVFFGVLGELTPVPQVMFHMMRGFFVPRLRDLEPPSSSAPTVRVFHLSDLWRHHRRWA